MSLVYLFVVHYLTWQQVFHKCLQKSILHVISFTKNEWLAICKFYNSVKKH